MLPLLLLKTSQGHPVVSDGLFTAYNSPQNTFIELSAKCTNSIVWMIISNCPRPAALILSKPNQLVELKNGETYNGHMVQCDTWMNIHLREVICTSKVSGMDFAMA
jgi:hypothetical protein